MRIVIVFSRVFAQMSLHERINIKAHAHHVDYAIQNCGPKVYDEIVKLCAASPQCLSDTRNPRSITRVSV